MPPCRNVISLLLVSVVLSLKVPSAQAFDCKSHYFSWKHYVRHFNASVPHVVASNLKDSMECSAERECLTGESINKDDLIPLLNCFGREIEDDCTETPKCKALKSYRNISYYHFLCLTAKALEMDPTSDDHLDCEYEYVCPLIQNLPRTDQTTKQPLTTSTTVKATTTAVKATTTTTLPERTTAAPTVSQPGSQPTTTSGRAHSQGMLKNANSSSPSEQEKTSQLPVLSLLTILLIVSVIGNVISCLYIKRQRRTFERNSLTGGLVLAPAGVQLITEMESNTGIESPNGRGVESSHLLQPHECLCVVTDRVEQNNHES